MCTWEGVQFSSVAQSCLTLCSPVNCSMPGLPVHCQLPELTQTPVHWLGDAIEPFHLIRPRLLLPSIFPRIRVFSNESTLHMRWPKYWRFSFSISPSNEHPGLISFRMDWLDLLAVQGTLKSLLQHHSSKASIFRHSAFSYMLTKSYSSKTLWTPFPPLHLLLSFWIFLLNWHEISQGQNTSLKYTLMLQSLHSLQLNCFIPASQLSVWNYLNYILLLYSSPTRM